MSTGKRGVRRRRRAGRLAFRPRRGEVERSRSWKTEGDHRYGTEQKGKKRQREGEVVKAKERREL